MTPRIRVPHRDDLLNFVKRNSIVAESGVLYGAFSKKILKQLEPARFYLIDLWDDDYEIHMHMRDDGQGWERITGPQAYAEVQQLWAKHPRVTFLRGHSCDMIRSLPDNHLDMIYLDSDHGYRHVLEELSEAWGKVKSGGWIMGHDYTIVIPTVAEAVHEFCRQYRLQLDVLTDEKDLPVLGVPGITMAAYNSYGIRVWK